MPRLIESRSWSILKLVPAEYFRLVKEVLSLRQKIVVTRQSIHFLRRCIHYHVIPSFITNKRLHDTCGLPKDSRQIKSIELQILKMALKTKRDQLYSCLMKCVAKENCCERFVPARLWRRIVGESRCICDYIRSNAKTRLQEKFDRLVDQERYRRSRDQITSNHLLQVNNTGTPSPQSRVTLLGDVTLSNDARSVLELGPSYAPVQSISSGVSRKVICGLQTLHDRLRSSANAELRGMGAVVRSIGNFPALPFPSTYFRPQDPHPAVDAKFRIFATSVYRVVKQYADKRPISNLTGAQRRGIKGCVHAGKSCRVNRWK